MISYNHNVSYILSSLAVLHNNVILLSWKQSDILKNIYTLQ